MRSSEQTTWSCPASHAIHSSGVAFDTGFGSRDYATEHLFSASKSFCVVPAWDKFIHSSTAWHFLGHLISDHGVMPLTQISPFAEGDSTTVMSTLFWVTLRAEVWQPDLCVQR